MPGGALPRILSARAVRGGKKKGEWRGEEGQDGRQSGEEINLQRSGERQGRKRGREKKSKCDSGISGEKLHRTGWGTEKLS